MNSRNLLCGFLLLLSVIYGYCQECPTIMPRNRWGGRPPRNPNLVLPLKRVQYIVLHHTNSLQCVSHGSCASLTRNIYNLHTIQKRYNDIGYNFMIGGNGLVYEGRGWRTQGEFAPTFNARSLNIALAGVYNTVLPSQRIMASFKALIRCGIRQGYIPERGFSYIVHRQLRDNACPGDALFRYIQTWPGHNSNPR